MPIECLCKAFASVLQNRPSNKIQSTEKTSLRTSGSGHDASGRILRGICGKQPKGLKPPWECELWLHFSSQRICFMLWEMPASLMLFTLCQGLRTFPSLPSLQLLLFFKGQGGPGTHQPLASLPTAALGRSHQLLRDSSCSLVFMCLSTGWRSWLAYKPARTENKH